MGFTVGDVFIATDMVTILDLGKVVTFGQAKYGTGPGDGGIKRLLCLVQK